MIWTNTSVQTNATGSQPSSEISDMGLTVGLTVFFVFLLLVIVVGVFTVKWFGRLRGILPLGPTGSREKEDDLCVETPRIVKECHKYTSRPEISTQIPIYENVTRTTSAYHTNNQIRSPVEAEEDVYLQCDVIYSNDPECNLSVHTDQEDDTYIVPDS